MERTAREKSADAQGMPGIVARAADRALIPAALVCAGAGVTAIGARFEHAVYEGLACTATSPEPVWAAVFLTSAVLLAVAALVTAGMSWGTGRGALCVSATAIAMVGTVFVGSVAGPRNLPDQPRIIGTYWIFQLVVALLVAGAVFGIRAVRRAPLSAAWISAGLLLPAAVVAVGLLGDWYWFAPDALQRVCLAG